MRFHRFTMHALVAVLLSAISAPVAPAEEPSSFPEWQCLYVGDFGRACIYKITSDKKVSVYARGTPSPCNLFFDEKGVLYVGGGDGVRTVTPTEDGSPATKDNGHVKVLLDGLSRVHGCTRDGKGNLWICTYLGADTGKKNKIGQAIFEPGTVYMRKPDGTLVKIRRDPGYSLTTSPDGNVYISIQQGGIFAKIAEDGTKTVVARQFVSRGAIFDKDGTAYAVGPGGVHKLTRDGNQSLIVDFKADEFGAMHPFSLAIDANGTFYQSDPPRDKKINPGASQGFIFHFGSEGKRSVFIRVGVSPAWMAFWPTSLPANRKAVSDHLIKGNQK